MITSKLAAQCNEHSSIRDTVHVDSGFLFFRNFVWAERSIHDRKHF